MQNSVYNYFTKEIFVACHQFRAKGGWSTMFQQASHFSENKNKQEYSYMLIGMINDREIFQDEHI